MFATPHLNKTFAAATTATVLALCASPALAGAAAPISTYFFNGNCADCAVAANVASYGVLGTLTLQNYSDGTTIQPDHFVSFEYSGSNLIDPYTVTANFLPTFAPALTLRVFETVASVDGQVSTGAGDDAFDLRFDDGLGFQSRTDGEWFTCAPGPAGYYSGGQCSRFNNADIGSGTWSATATVALGPGLPLTVPVPASYTLVALALGLLGLERSRRVARQA